ncbi:MAG: PIG-L family deacetylase, partial [Burkholderiaceae bacterium]
MTAARPSEGACTEAGSAAIDAVAPTDEAAQRRIHGEGTPESAWRAWDALRSLPRLSVEALVPASSRVVVAAPHPDDEVLGCGGALAALARGGRRILVVGVTDGENSHADSLKWTARLLARERRQERQRGLDQLGVAEPPLALRLPDGGVAAAEGVAARALMDIVRPGDVLISTWRFDGHPDHEA